jgi:hypothetical protein
MNETCLFKIPEISLIQITGTALGRCKQLYKVGPPNIWGLNFFLINFLPVDANSKSL